MNLGCYKEAKSRIEDLLNETLQKAKQKQAIEESTNWQMKAKQQPELSAEAFLRSQGYCEDWVFWNTGLDLLTEFKNQK